jgi:hypothetical protein
MKKSFVISFLLAVIMAFALKSLAQDNKLTSNKELASNARTICVQSGTIHIRRENLESALMGKDEVKAWDIQVTSKPALADLVIRVRRTPFYRTHFTYEVTDRVTDTIVMAGNVDSIKGVAYGQIADEIVKKMKAFRGDPAKQATPSQTQAKVNLPTN